MANATVLRVGSNNGGSDKTELFLKVFGGEVLAAFEEECVTVDKHKIRTIKSGKSAQFPATWKVNANYHTPGTEIVGQTSNVSERVITIDDVLIADVTIPQIDEAMNHFDYRSEYSAQAGYALANAWDKNVLQTGVLAARASATVSGADGGSTFTSAGTDYKTDSNKLAAGYYAAVQALVEKNVPKSMPKFGFLRPAQYYLLAQNTALFNTQVAANNGNYADGTVLRIGGVILTMTNHLPITNITTGLAKYQGDFSKTASLVMTPAAVGTVKLLDLAMESEWDMRRQVTLILAKYAIGMGILRPECAVELKTTT